MSVPAADVRLDELRALLQERSIARGDFVLTSGARSRYYCDTKATVLSPRGSRLIGEALHKLLLPFEVEAVGGPEVGGAYLATATAMASDASCGGCRNGGDPGASPQGDPATEPGERPLFGFLVRNRAKGHGTTAKIDASYHPDGRKLIAPGRRVAVVDDVVTSAGSILRAIEAVEAEGCEVAAVSAVVDRQQGGGDLLREQGRVFRPLFLADGEGNLTPASDEGR